MLIVECGEVLLQRLPASGIFQQQQVVHRALEVWKLKFIIVKQLLQPVLEEIRKIWWAKAGQCRGAGTAQFSCTAAEPTEQWKGKAFQPLTANQVNPRLANVL